MGVMVLVGFLSLVLAGAISVYYEIRSYKVQHVEYITSLVKVIGANSASAILFDDEKSANETLSALRIEKSVVCAGLFDREKKLFARYVREEVDQMPAWTEAGHYEDKDSVFVVSPIVWKGEAIGTAFIYTDKTALREQLFALTRMNVAILLVSVIATVFLSLWLHGIVTAPLMNIIRVARRVAEKRDYALRVPVDVRNDEVGTLSKVFNQMLSYIQERDNDLQKAHDELEARVYERTRELQELSYMLRNILANMPVVAFRINKDGIFTESMGNGLSRLGLRSSEAVGRNAYEMYPDLVESIKKAMTGEMVLQEATGMLKDQRWYFTVYFFPDLDRPGQIIGFAMDITDQRVAQEHEQILQDQLVRAERMKSLGILAGGVAHDLNNVLGPMVILPQVIISDIRAQWKDSEVNTTEIIEDLRIIESSAHRAAAVIKDLMTLGRRGNYQRVPIDINLLVGKYMSSSEFLELKKNADVDIALKLDDSAGPVLCSESHLGRAISNLVRNGCESIAGAGRVEVRTSNVVLEKPLIGYEIIPAARYTVLSVSDTGGGIAAEDLERIFEPFFTKKKQSGHSGSGLGLSVVHGVVKDHEGYIDVKSALGKGSAFDLYFPALEVCANGPDERIEAEVRGGNERILFVDDEPAQRLLAQRALGKWGYTVTVATGGREGLEIYRNAFNDGKPYDLVMLDMIMESGFDGLSTLQHMLEICPEQKVVIASGYAPTKRGKEAIRLGAVWLSKPYDITDLALTVRAKLDEKKT